MSDKEEERPSNPKEVLVNFGQTSTVGALPQYCASYWVFFKILWIVVFIVGMALTGLHIYSLFRTYYKYPMQVTVEVKTNETLEFPAITICNLNPIKYSKAKAKNSECAESGPAEILKLQEQFASGVISSKFLKNAYKEYIKDWESNHDENDKPPKLNIWARKLLGMRDYKKCADDKKEAKSERKRRDVSESNEQDTSTTTTTEPTLGSLDPNEDWEDFFDEETFKFYDGQEDYNYTDFEYYPESEGEGGFGDEDSYHNFLGDSDAEETDFGDFMHKSKLDDLIDIKDLYLFDWNDIGDGMVAEEFFLECTIDRTRCSHKNFKKIINKRYGNCFIFNSALFVNDGEEVVKPNRTRKSGRENGLRLTLNIQADEYLGLLSDSYGIAVSIHDANSYSLPEVDGFVVSPGVETKVLVKLKQVKRLPHPFKSNCTKAFPDNLKRYVIPNSNYTVRQCQLACKDYHLENECGCVEQIDAFAESQDEASRVCSVFKVEERKCHARTHERLALESGKNGSLLCDCASSCTDNLFEYGLSFATWPTEGYQRLKMGHFYGREKRHHLATKLLEELVAHEQTDDVLFEDWIKQNLVRLHIYYESLTYEIVQEQEAYSSTQLISDIGGVVGLYLGMSLVTLVEVFQLIIMLAVTGLRTKPKNKRSLAPTKSALYPGSD